MIIAKIGRVCVPGRGWYVHRGKVDMGAKSKRVLNRYEGRLSAADIAEGMNAARRNAKRLYADAKALLDAERFPTAASLAALAIEESGKVTILRELALATTDEEARSAWRAYRDHRSKNGMWILPALVAKGARQLKDFSEAVDSEGAHTSLLDAVKQIGLYSDCFGKKKNWSEPEKVIDAKIAKALVEVAEILSGNSLVSVREVELWVEIMSPVWGTPQMGSALMHWQQVLFNEGLSTHSDEDMRRFVFGGEDEGQPSKMQ